MLHIAPTIHSALVVANLKNDLLVTVLVVRRVFSRNLMGKESAAWLDLAKDDVIYFHFMGLRDWAVCAAIVGTDHRPHTPTTTAVARKSSVQ